MTSQRAQSILLVLWEPSSASTGSPQFWTEAPRSLTTSSKDAKLSLPIFGFPIPKISWLNESGEKLSEIAEKRLIKNTKTHAVLEVREADYSDVGVYQLHLENDSGKSVLKLNLLVLAPPTEPTGEITVSDVDATQCVLTWNTPAYDGGAALSNYVVEKREVHRPV